MAARAAMRRARKVAAAEAPSQVVLQVAAVAPGVDRDMVAVATAAAVAKVAAAVVMVAVAAVIGAEAAGGGAPPAPPVRVEQARTAAARDAVPSAVAAVQLISRYEMVVAG